jgi:hypothetical protein
MAVVPFTPGISLVPQLVNNCVAIYTWTPLTFSGLDSGQPIQGPGWTDRSVQITGTFGAGGTIVIEGSNDGVNYSTLHDTFGNTLSLTQAAVTQILEISLLVRPRVTAGDGTTSLNAIFLGCAHNPN